MITFIVILAAIVFCMWFFQNQIVGHIGEKHTANRIRAISKGTVFRDVYVEGSHGVQQIDIIAVTEKGILVVEKKTYIGLIVGKAMSGAFLAHGYQANRLIAFNDKEVLIHAMGKASAARITKRTVDSLEELVSTIPPMAYDISNYATLGLLEKLLDIADPSSPTKAEVNLVVETVKKAVVTARNHGTSLDNRLGSPNRAGTVLVRRMMREQWVA